METELIVTFLAWFLGGFVNIITGIGGNLVALPVMLLALDFTVAAVVSCVIGALLGVMLVLRFYRFADARSVLLLSLGALPGLVAGVMCLKYLPIFSGLRSSLAACSLPLWSGNTFWSARASHTPHLLLRKRRQRTVGAGRRAKRLCFLAGAASRAFFPVWWALAAFPWLSAST